jgi:PleD family two-component response regulator
MRILIVDDSEDWRDLTEAALMAAGYDQVATAESAAAAYTKLGVGTPPGNGAAAVDLIVLDLVMPEIDGIEACARIRGDARYIDVPVIMVTAASDMDSLSSAFIAGATDYITKPFNRVELLARVRSALKIKAELDRRKSREGELTALMRGAWGDRDAGRWIDATTNLFVGTAAEAYLAASAQSQAERPVSVFALGVDRLDALTAARGRPARDAVLAQVADALAAIGAPIAVIATSYPDGVFVLVAPQLQPAAARALARRCARPSSRSASPTPKPSPPTASPSASVSSRQGGAAPSSSPTRGGC